MGNGERPHQHTVELDQVEAEHGRRENDLQERIKQQAVVAALGQHALVGTDLSTLFDEAVRALAATLNVEYTK
ncbi:MAG: HTR-like protein, partial [Chloroflexota bacterium]|nr:HTR-like protein [Chloroflexota bacterium]